MKLRNWVRALMELTVPALSRRSARRSLRQWDVSLHHETGYLLSCGAIERLEYRTLLTKFLDDGTLALFAQNPIGVVEPAVPIYHNGTLIDGVNHQVIAAFDGVPDGAGFPLTFVDLAVNTYIRATYQRIGGTSGPLGTSIVGSPSFRTPDGVFHFIPSVSRGDVTTNGIVRYQSVLTASFPSLADVSSTRVFPDPLIGRTTVALGIHFEATADISLATAQPFLNNDRFRVLTLSSMFSSSTQFDANLIRYEGADGVVKTIRLTDSIPRGQHLLPAPAELGSWVELVKTEGSTWFSDSPTIRIELLNDAGLNLGLQGFLASTTDPNDDSLSVWFEVLGTPNTIADGTTFDISTRIIATRAEPLFDFGDAPDLSVGTGNRELSDNTGGQRPRQVGTLRQVIHVREKA